MQIKILIGLFLLGSMQYLLSNPPTYKPRDLVLDQIKHEFNNECFPETLHTYKFYSCRDLKNYIDKREKELNELYK